MASGLFTNSLRNSAEKNGLFVAVDVYSGAGGLTEGFKLAGFEVAVAVDNDEYVEQTYKFNHPEVHFIRGKVENINGDKILDLVAKKGFLGVDVLIGGPPCQAFSFANTQSGGIENPLSNGVWEFLRLIKEIKPTVFVMENVLGLRSKRNGHVSAQIVEKTQQLGYESKSEPLCAVDFGVPQKRRRTFVFGTKLKAPLGVVSNRKKATLKVSTAISDLPPLPEGGGGSEIADYEKKPQNRYQSLMRENSPKLLNHTTSKSGSIDPNVIERFKRIPQGKSLNDVWPKLPSNLKEGIACVQTGYVHSNIYRRLRWREPAPTIVHVRKAVLLHPFQDRLLSVREAARLQSFFDRYRFFGSVSREYQQVADAVPVFMANGIADKVMSHLMEAGAKRKEQSQAVLH